MGTRTQSAGAANAPSLLQFLGWAEPGELDLRVGHHGLEEAETFLLVNRKLMSNERWNGDQLDVCDSKKFRDQLKFTCKCCFAFWNVLLESFKQDWLKAFINHTKQSSAGPIKNRLFCCLVTEQRQKSWVQFHSKSEWHKREEIYFNDPQVG